LAMCLVIASAPFDIAISSVIWNPPVAAALIKMATASALQLDAASPRWRVVLTAALAWFAVQAHLSAIFVGGPLLLALAARELIVNRSPRVFEHDHTGTSTFRDRLKQAGLTAGVIAAVVVILQIPYLMQIARDPAAPMGPTSAISNIANAESFRLDRSYNSIVNGVGELLARQFDNWDFRIPAAIAALIVLITWRRDVVLLAVSIGGIVGATVLFATWTRGYDSYWFLTLSTALVLTFGMAVAAIPYRPAIQVIAALLLAGVAMAQPARVEQSKTFFKYPPYRTMRIASYELAARHPVLRDIRVNFDGVHPTMDKYIMYTILGGRIDKAAPQQAYVNGDGSVRVE